MGTEEGETIMSVPRKRALATWQTYYHTTINGTGQIVNRLLPLIQQCKAIYADSLKSSKIHLARQMSSLKMEFNSSFERLLDKLNSLTGEILIKALGENPQKKDKDKLNSYWMDLQLEIVQKIRKLTIFQNDLNSRCSHIFIKIEYADLAGPSNPQEPPGSGTQARSHRYAPNPHILPTDREKP